MDTRANSTPAAQPPPHPAPVVAGSFLFSDQPAPFIVTTLDLARGALADPRTPAEERDALAGLIGECQAELAERVAALIRDDDGVSFTGDFEAIARGYGLERAPAAVRAPAPLAPPPSTRGPVPVRRGGRRRG